MSSSALTTTDIGALTSSSTASTPAAISLSVPVRLDHGNFLLWKGLLLPNLSGADLHGHLDGTKPAPATEITTGEGDKAVTVPNPAYHPWWLQDQKVLGFLLGAMEPSISCQLIGCKTAAAAWTSVHAMFGAHSRANVRNIRRQLQSLRKEDRSAAEYMHMMKALADSMAAAGSPISDDDLVDYIITGLGSAYNGIAASLTVGNKSVPYVDFYSHILSFEALQAQQAQVEGWTSSANAASRPPPPADHRPRAPDYYTPPAPGAYRPNGGGTQHGGGGGNPYGGHNSYGGHNPYGNPYGGHNTYGGGNTYENRGGGNSGGGRNGRGGGRGGGGRNGGGRQRWRPRCDYCGYWGHLAPDCRRAAEDQRANNFITQRSGNAASTSGGGNPQWHLDSGATDHLTSELERLQFYERYGGKDQVQVANGSDAVCSQVPGPASPQAASSASPIDVHGTAMQGSPRVASASPLPEAASPTVPALQLAPEQPVPPSADSLAAGPSAAPPTGSTHAMVTRARDHTRTEKVYTDGTVRYDPRRRAFFAAPSSHREALQEPAWSSAMADEFAALTRTGTWKLVPRPPGVNIVGSKWIFKTKHRPDGSIDKHKARLVARGFTQQHGIDYGDTFSPVVKPATVRLVLSLAVSRGWCLRQVDVSNAFLHGFLNEDVYMQQPPGFEDARYPSHVCKLQRSIYGLKQSPRAWYARLSQRLYDLGFSASKADTSLFFFSRDGVEIYMLVYVDDIVISGSTPEAVDRLVHALAASFPIKDMGKLDYFLGLEASYNSGGMTLTQRKYALDLLHRVNMENCNSAPTPLMTSERLARDTGTALSTDDAFSLLTLIGKQ
ncbi:hypothetical protein QYE76_030467 [Lolium multiflorum]|uniref:Reverse transcriptase Ty1/copia-type domain-containing protein n=1 Tax=Lolium multiflorum TaxID=4521 RepID=A0AAD8VJ96_LOLMU|nr:hypothetical protein QYE76_030458 [Lolium multiflorum]KAK1606794.1 hypothetical protein QYE76_030467 [Lolium multiflorum]